MEEDIKILEEHLAFIKNFDNGSEYIPALENLIARNKELEEEIEKWKFTAKYVENNYIDKLKVREILEDLDNNKPVIAEQKLRKLLQERN